MSIWTRLAQALSQVGDSIGGFLSQLAQRSATPPEKSIAFTIGMIALGAKMAKADGVVTHDEIRAFRQVFHVPEQELAAVARVFDLAKRDVAGFETYARQIAKLFNAKAAVLENVLDGLFHIARADHALHPAEIAFLQRIAELFGFEPADFARISARYLPAGAEDPFAVLGVSRDASRDEIKARYRKLVRDNHPDRQIAAGVPEEMVILATERLAKINAAFDRIMKAAK
jgi:DnaJ like chaperone protein